MYYLTRWSRADYKGRRFEDFLFCCCVAIYRTSLPECGGWIGDCDVFAGGVICQCKRPDSGSENKR